MANIFFKTGGDFSTLVPYKTTYANLASTYYYASYGAYDLLNSAFYVAVTPSDAGDVTGVFAMFWIGQRSATQSCTVTLQENVASVWTDRVSKTLTYDQMIGTYSSTITLGAGNVSTFFEFASPYTVTTAANTWRIKFLATTNNQCGLARATGGNVMALPINTTTTYSSGDNFILNAGITMTIDQSVTSTTFMFGVDSKLEWKTPPASAYTLAITTTYLACGCEINIGTSANRIPYAQQATINLGNIRATLCWSNADVPWKLNIYGEIPTNFKTTVGSNAAAGQKNLVTTDNMSASWVAGDTLRIFSGSNPQTQTIASVSGTTVTTNANLGPATQTGYAVLNVTRYQKCGVKLGGNVTATSDVGNLAVCQVSGLYLSSYFLSLGFFYFNVDIHVPTVSHVLPVLLEYITGENYLRVVEPTSYSANALISARHNGSIMRHVYIYGDALSNQVYLTTAVAWALSDIYTGGYLNTVYLLISNSTVTDLQVCDNWTGFAWTYFSTLVEGSLNTFTNCRFTSVNMACAGLSNTFTSCLWDNQSGSSQAIFFNNTTVDCRFNSCSFGSKVQVAAIFSANPGVYVQAIVNNSSLNFSGVAVRTTYADLLAGSSIKFDTYNATTNDHRSWYKYGLMQSTGSGLSDTTVHTSGSGKFALRYEPTSSSSNLSWDVDVPTGDISTKTMTVAVWCKINSATYYAGTHQLPRLTINYDNGTTAYSQAAESTSWQLLFVTFTPSTTYGKITMTLSGRTNATGSNAYVYWDDFTVAYPPSVSLDLGGMDNWANALPVTPPVAIPLSALTVAQGVWQQLTTTSWGTDSMGEALKALPTSSAPTAASIADAVWDEATSGHTSAGSFGKETQYKQDAIKIIIDGEIPIT